MYLWGGKNCNRLFGLTPGSLFLREGYKKTVPPSHEGGTVQSIIHEKTLFRESLFWMIMVKVNRTVAIIFHAANVNVLFELKKLIQLK
jgi:hypothetical protein